MLQLVRCVLTISQCALRSLLQEIQMLLSIQYRNKLMQEIDAFEARELPPSEVFVVISTIGGFQVTLNLGHDIETPTNYVKWS
jgi:hypothetical protein